MTVVKFPDEIFRIILNKLDQEPKFKIYLGILEKCIQRDLDVEPLIQWWNKNCSRIGYDDAEHEFLDTIDRVKLGNRSWNEEKIFRIKEHEKILKNYHKDKLNSSKSDLRSELSVVDELVQVIKDDVNNRNAWGLDNPEYKSTLWMKEWVPLFTSIYGDNGPLGIIAKRFDGFFDNKIISDWNDTKRNTEPMPMKEFRYTLLDKPLYIAFESDAHHLLMNISNWIGKERKNLANLVFSYLLTSPEEKTNFNMLDLLNAALTCTHQLFSYLMRNGIFDTCDREVLGLILQIPLAETARPEGQPHLTPEFSFIWPSFDPSNGLPNTAVDEETAELAKNWKNFFHSYTKLRIEKNNGKNFQEASYIYYAAISSICQDQFFHEPSSEFKNSCILHSLDIVQADIFCALEYFNEFYYPVLQFLLFSDLPLDKETDALTTEEILTFTNVQLSLVCHLIEKEGWYDLACSMFSFYLILAIIASNGNLDAIEDLPKVIKSLSGLPRFEYVSRAIDFACSVALENGRSTTFARLDQFRQSIDEEIKSLIAGGETQLCEFKSTLRRNLHTGQDDHKIEHSVLKTIAGFLNKEGGQLLIGVSDDRDITGIEADGFESFDKWQLHFKNLVNQALPSAMDFIECKEHAIREKTVAVIKCNRSQKPVYYRNRQSKVEEFYVRRGNATDNLAMSDAFEYIRHHFQS